MLMPMDAKIQAYLRQLAKKGGKAQKAKYSKAMLSKWGKLGGRPRKVEKP
jgi:hypothetical protein